MGVAVLGGESEEDMICVVDACWMEASRRRLLLVMKKDPLNLFVLMIVVALVPRTILKERKGVPSMMS